MPNLLRPGQKLRGDELEIVQHLGSGGIGEVYRAIWRSQGTQRYVAIKCFDPQKLREFELDAIQLVHRESLAVSRINHPHAIQIHAVELDGSMPFIVEEFIPEGDLARLIAARKEAVDGKTSLLSPREIVSIAQQVASVLVAMHQENLFHGDIKPSNLCLRREKPLELVLVDFGHAGFLEGNILDRNDGVATLAYLPPERTGFGKLAGSATSDLYALGVSLYEAACGSPPFHGSDSRELINRLLHEVPRPLHEILPDFPLPLSGIISKLLRKNPEERYHSAFGLLADIQRCLESLDGGSTIAPFALGTKDKLRELNYHIPMVGRVQELNHLKDLFQTAQGGGSAVAFVGAPSGTGKSRLAFEVLHAAREQKAYISFAKYSEYEKNLPLSAVSVLFAEHSQYLTQLSARELIHWQKAVEKRLGERIGLIQKRFPCYRDLLPVHHSAELADNDFDLVNRTLAEFISLLPAAGELHLLLVDDLQWADWQSLRVLGELVRMMQQDAIPNLMLLGTYRSNEVSPDHALTTSVLDVCPTSVMELGPLSRSDADSLIQQLLDESGAEVAKLQEVAYKFTEGNPFSIYEYLKSAIQSGVYALDDKDKCWYFHEERILHAKLSAGVAGLVAQRIRALPEQTQWLIGIASLAGVVMKREALQAILPAFAQHRKPGADASHEGMIERGYRELLEKHLLQPHPDGFAFFHDRIQEAAYSLLTNEDKLFLHREYGLWCARHLETIPIHARDSFHFEAAWHLCHTRSQALPPYARRTLFEAAQAARRLFAYDKAKDYLRAAAAAVAASPDGTVEERIEYLELLADTLAVSEEIAEAIALYDQILESLTDPLKRAHIFAKQLEYCMSLFDYKRALEASINGLELLGDRVIKNELVAYLYILVMTPVLLLYVLYFRLFGRQTRELETDFERIRFRLLIKYEIPIFFMRPIVAMANLIPRTWELLKYKDNEYRNIMLFYWAIILIPFGFERSAAKLFKKTYDYFDQMANPMLKGYALSCWGYCFDFPLGRLQEAQQKLEEAVRYLETVGESFWRSIALLGLIQIDYFGGETGQAGVRTRELIALWKRVRSAPTFLGITARHFLEEGLDEDVTTYTTLCLAAEQEIRDQGYDSIDSVFAALGPAEVHYFRGEFEKAEELLKRAFRNYFIRVHRSAYAVYTPIVYASTLVHLKKLRKALPIIAAAWLNQVLRAHIYRPQTWAVTGEWFYAAGWPRLGRFCLQRGISIAGKQGWASVVAEGRLAMGGWEKKRNPEEAEVMLRLAKDHFYQRHWGYHESLCDRLLMALQRQRVQQETSQRLTSTHRSGTNRKPGQIRQQLEVKALLNIFLKLSAIKDRDALETAILDSFCLATGSELAVLIFHENGSWTPKVGRNIELGNSESFARLVDWNFATTSMQRSLATPLVRPSVRDPADKRPQGSAMIVPLAYEGKNYGYCYLANTQLYELFDDRSLEIVSSVATQGAIALQNILLKDDLAVERDQVKTLNQTLEQRVFDQTRDIKSIMQHIPMGICTISGRDAVINRDHSRFLQNLFERDHLEQVPLLPLLLNQSQLSEDERDQIRNALQAILGEADVAFSLNEHLLPRTLRWQATSGQRLMLELEWSPISGSNGIEKLLVTLNDVTHLREMEEKAQEKDHDMRIASEIMGCDERSWQRFLSASRRYLGESRQLFLDRKSSDLRALIQTVFMNVHTIKGTARSLQLRQLNETLHRVEQRLSHMLKDTGAGLDQAEVLGGLSEADELLSRYETIALQKLGRLAHKSQAVALASDVTLEIHAILQQLEQRKLPASTQVEHVARALRASLFMDMETLMQDIFASAQSLARDLGKAPPIVQWELPRLWVTPQGEEALRNIFLHLIRNSLDHGVETPEERRAFDKSERGLLKVSVVERHGYLELKFADDGRGLYLKHLRRLAEERALLSGPELYKDEAVADLIFLPELSTAGQISDISGRGIGMPAVRRFVEDLGGQIAIQFTDDRPAIAGYRPFAFVLTFPTEIFPSAADGMAA
ncbi:protein kinase domain-containing protein [Oligoflexus tunisiensis]|uniref:protein kinase domain-containing protein n=1 Tax=Oligoflexus tunisiensis TaxID=708132 RepID=UPI00114CF11A|nr:protein kinase [Oligoflexus tunisiensis]